MSNETQITLTGNLAEAPELRFTPSGQAVANFRVGSTPKKFDKASGEFKDGETLWLTCTVWRQQAENVAETLERGMRVIVHGNLISRSYQTKDGENRTVQEVDVTEVGPSLLYAQAKVVKATTATREDGSKPGKAAEYDSPPF